MLSKMSFSFHLHPKGANEMRRKDNSFFSISQNILPFFEKIILALKKSVEIIYGSMSFCVCNYKMWLIYKIFTE
jgi:hypothetical protein